MSTEARSQSGILTIIRGIKVERGLVVRYPILHMKTKTVRTLSVLCLTALVWARALSALADEQVAASQAGKTYSGMITSVDPKEKTLTVKKFWFNETFNIGDDCTIAVGGRKSAALSDLRPGQKVEV